MSAYWAEHALLPSGPAGGVRIEVDGDTFASIETRRRPRDGDVELRGVLLSGLANAHSHAFHRALRGRTHGDGGNFWTWRELRYAVTERLNPDTYLSLAAPSTQKWRSPGSPPSASSTTCTTKSGGCPGSRGT